MAARIAAMVLYYGEDFRDEPIQVCTDRATVTNADRAMRLGVKLPEAGAMPAAPPAVPATPAPVSPAPATPTPASPAPATPAPATPAQPVVVPK
jgi:hypothetical protein